MGADVDLTAGEEAVFATHPASTSMTNPAPTTVVRFILLIVASIRLNHLNMQIEYLN